MTFKPWILVLPLGMANMAFSQITEPELENDINANEYVASSYMEPGPCAELNKKLTQKLQTDSKQFLDTLAEGVKILSPLKGKLDPEDIAILEKVEKRIAKFGSEEPYVGKDGKSYASYAEYKAKKASEGALDCAAENQAIRGEYVRLLGTDSEPGKLTELGEELEDIAESVADMKEDAKEDANEDESAL